MMLEKACEELYDGLKQVRELYGDKFVSFKDFTTDEITKFRKVNVRLREYEKVMKQEVENLYTYAQDRLVNKNDIVIDFEIEINLYFYLDEQHPAYNEDDSDNILTILYTTKYDIKCEHGFGDKKDHNTLPAREGTAMEHDKHCAVFHALYDHTELHYQELLTIGSFELDIKLHLEYDEIAIKST